MSAYGFVYILVNEYMPEVYKVGCTERSPHTRAEEVSNSTGVPAPFRVLCYIECGNFQAVERALHGYLAHYRISPNREFFHTGLGAAVQYLWWLPERLTFCAPELAGDGASGDYGFLTDPQIEGEFNAASNLMSTQNPWARRRSDPAPEPKLLLVANGTAVADNQPEDDCPF